MNFFQMIGGLLVNYRAYSVLARGDYCKTTYENIVFSVIMYFSYFALFGHFFYTSYLVKPSPKESITKKVA